MADKIPMKYEILDTISFDKRSEGLISRCYEIWKSVYEPILAEANEQILSDYFYRAKMISLLHEDGEVLAFALHNNMPLVLDGIIDASYFSPVPLEVREQLKLKKKAIMTIEWVTANPAIRGRFTKIQPGEIVVGLAMRLVTISPWDAVMGFSRTDIKADKTAAKFGAKSLGLVKRHDIECEIMYADKENITNHPFEKVEKVISQCWVNRLNHSPYIKNAEYSVEEKQAA